MTSHTTTKQSIHSPQLAFTDRARAMWSTGDFARVAARLVLVGELLCRSVDVHAGERVLDVAAGSGNAAISAARRGARVTASDFVGPLLEAAQARAEVEGLCLATAVADAQELPFEDESFDVVLSTFGAMFAPDQQRAADELAARLPAGRPDRPGELGSRRADGGATRRSCEARPPPPASPRCHAHRVGHEARLRELFGDASASFGSSAGRSTYAPARPLSWSSSTATGSARHERRSRSWTRQGQASLAADLAAELERFNRATDGTLVAEAEYLEVVAVKA